MSGHHSNSCFEYLGQLSPGYRLLYFINPVASNLSEQTVWIHRSQTWDAVYLLNIVVCSIFYITIGILAATCLVTQETRLKTKTFCVTYMCIALLGFTRAVFLLLDPYGIFGWIADRWLPWIVVSRLLSALAFPCLTASYTLVFLTLWRVDHLGPVWYDSWPVILTITLPHYIVAIIAEAIANASPYPALVCLIVCDIVFILWGITVSTIFLIAGYRLVRMIKDQTMESSRVSLSYSRKVYDRHMNRMGPAIRKIARISYATATLTLMYSLSSIVSLVLTNLLILSQCLGYYNPGNAIAWLTLQTIRGTIEILLAFVILYSITKVSTVVKNTSTCCKSACNKLWHHKSVEIEMNMKPAS